MDDDGAGSTTSTLIARIEAYAADPASLTVPGSWTRHPQWLDDEAQRLDAATQLAEELMALQSIYTDDAVHLLKITPLSSEIAAAPAAPAQDEQLGSENVADPNSWLPGSKITLSVSTDVEAASESIPIRLAVTLPPFYPHGARPPQLQLLSRYIGGFSVDAKLFGEILRAFYHEEASGDAAMDAEEADVGSAWAGGSAERGVQWASGQVVLFEASSVPPPAPFSGTLFQTASIIERKSEFIGYAARITSPTQVASVLSRILSDKRVARATHPIINAWVCSTSDGVVHRDCDDDGETAAGGRLAHLLSILELDHVMVVVTRWYGGVHLGPDRFKLINRVAREALDLGGFVGKNGGADEAGRGKGMRKRNA
ncbi:related to YIH1 [Sporisorium reilianum SRZ2]|uniref:Related to YIH1 n=1 Tax=Sporisorium reilianum (strain SRZ2) TaxID=999809 RepID=E6ZZJ7_SPORE|nr:related to YIH1 [Sporisorium reilianum SRZ2]